MFERSDSQTDADFARAFGDRDQHDVHDADAVDEKAGRCHRTKQAGHGANGAGERFGDLHGVHDAEIVLGIYRELAPLAHQATDLFHQRIGISTTSS